MLQIFIYWWVSKNALAKAANTQNKELAVQKKLHDFQTLDMVGKKERKQTFLATLKSSVSCFFFFYIYTG